MPTTMDVAQLSALLRYLVRTEENDDITKETASKVSLPCGVA
jgi:hypothetical protein